MLWPPGGRQYQNPRCTSRRWVPATRRLRCASPDAARDDRGSWLLAAPTTSPLDGEQRLGRAATRLPRLLLPAAHSLLPAEGITLPAPERPLLPTSALPFFPRSPAPRPTHSTPLLAAPPPHAPWRAGQENTVATALLLQPGRQPGPGASGQYLLRPLLARLAPSPAESSPRLTRTE